MYGESLGDRFDDFTSYIQQLGFEHVGGGTFREVYLRKKMVIKVPYSTDGIIDNRVEAAAWRRYRDRPTSRELRLAPCRLLPNLCLMMVAVDVSYNPNEPEWTSRVDNEQVGVYKGEVVAYDYAGDMVERREWETLWYGGIISQWYGDTLRAEKRAANGR